MKINFEPVVPIVSHMQICDNRFHVMELRNLMLEESVVIFVGDSQGMTCFESTKNIRYRVFCVDFETEGKDKAQQIAGKFVTENSVKSRYVLAATGDVIEEWSLFFQSKLGDSIISFLVDSGNITGLHQAIDRFEISPNIRDERERLAQFLESENVIGGLSAVIESLKNRSISKMIISQDLRTFYAVRKNGEIPWKIYRKRPDLIEELEWEINEQDALKFLGVFSFEVEIYLASPFCDRIVEFERNFEGIAAIKKSG